jgi:protein-S-isoprenylcysteine O-methyltransferase Ste14
MAATIAAPMPTDVASRTSTLLKTAVYSAVVPTLVTVVVPWWLLRSEHAGVPGLGWRSLGAVLIVPGALLYGWCAWTFVIVGRGTPNPADPPLELVARGPYRRVRNPMYLACLMIILGEAIAWPSTWLWKYALGSAAVMHALAWWEEGVMRRRFGDRYESYRRRVPRWIPYVGERAQG